MRLSVAFRLFVINDEAMVGVVRVYSCLSVKNFLFDLFAKNCCNGVLLCLVCWLLIVFCVIVCVLLL